MHTSAEDFILPAAIDMCTEILGESAPNKLKTIPLSNDTMRRRIKDMSEDITRQTSERISENGHYAQQLDESKDVANHTILMVYVRHVSDTNFKQFLFSVDLPTTTTTAEAVFNTMDMHLSSVGLAWDGCVGVTTDGAVAMRRKHTRVIMQILERAPSATWNHCFLHREALAAKDMVPELHVTLQDVIKCVNYIKKSSAKSFLGIKCLVAFMSFEQRLLRKLKAETNWTASCEN
jgi:hypothetical protein